MICKKMNWEKKLEALASIGDISLRMRKPGDWYVSHRASMSFGCFEGGPYGNGKSPQEAVENHWEIYANLNDPQYLDLRCVKVSKGKYVKWNGYMWKDFPPELWID